MSGSDFVPVFDLRDLPEGRMRACRVGGRELLVCRTPEGLHALDNVCTHAYARLTEGRLRGARLVCPLHGASFDVRDGRVLASPATQPLPVHAVRVNGERVEVALDPAAPAQMEA